MNKRRVALVALHFAEYSANLAMALAKKWEVLLVLYRDNADAQLGKNEVGNLSHSCLTLLVMDRPTSVLTILGNTGQLTRSIRRFDPHIIHYQEDPRDELMLGLLFLRSTPTVLTVHDPKTHSGADSDRLKYSRYRLYRPLFRRAADIAITHGRLLADDLIRACPRLTGRVRSVPHGPLGLRGANDAASRPSRPTDFRLLFFGRINEYKGLRYFVESVMTLRDKGYRVTGVVAGRGSDLERHRQGMEEAGCFEILDRYIAPEEISNLFLDSFAVILPYTDGTQSGVAAMALGFARPVVASAVGSIPELVRNRENGLLVPPSDSAALTEAIETLLTDKRLWESLANGARKLRDGELSWDSIADKTIRIYESVIEIRLAAA